MTIEYSDEQKHKINSKLYSLGVSTKALNTTLRISGKLDLQDMITSGVQKEHKAILFYPGPDDIKKNFYDNVQACELCYQLYIKENHLFRNMVYRGSMVDMYEALNDKQTYIGGSINLPSRHTLSTSDNVVICIEDFYRGHEQEFGRSDTRIREVYERYIKYLIYQKGVTLVLNSLYHPDHYVNSWSISFSSLLARTAKIIKIVA